MQVVKLYTTAIEDMLNNIDMQTYKDALSELNSKNVNGTFDTNDKKLLHELLDIQADKAKMRVQLSLINKIKFSHSNLASNHIAEILNYEEKLTKSTLNN